MPERLLMPVLAVGWALVTFLGQGLLIGLAVALSLRLARGRSADLRYAIASAGLLVMAACPVWSTARGIASGRWEPRVVLVPISPVGGATERKAHAVEVKPIAPVFVGRPSRGSEPGVIPSGGPRAMSPARGWRERVEAGLPYVVGAWMVGVGLFALRLLKGLAEVGALTRSGLVEPTGELLATIGRLAERAGVGRRVGWFFSERVEVPTVVGWLRPRILIPMESLAKLTLDQLEALLAHELAHVLRHDYVVNLLQVGVESLLFFHPAVWWVSGRMRLERENCCDDMAVALCGGDRRRLALALFRFEEQRGSTLKLSASGGSLVARIRRLVAPASYSRSSRAASGWAGAGILAMALALFALPWLAAPTRAKEEAPPSGKPTVHGRVVDEQGKPIAGATVRLYRREGRYERRHPLVSQTTSAADGAYALEAPLRKLERARPGSLPPYVLIADYPGKAVGWRTIPLKSEAFEGDILLTAPNERSITVVDGEGTLVPGVKVTTFAMGDPASASPHFRDVMELLRPDDGPLTAMTDANGRATFRQLPQTESGFVATKQGLAEGYALQKQDEIRMTPSGSLRGALVDLDGQALPGIKVVLAADFMWDFENAITDDRGQFSFQDLRARGWDMSAWGPGSKPGNGTYKVWIEDDRFAVPTQAVTIEPEEQGSINLQAGPAGIIRATVTEQGTNKPVPNIRVWGFDRVTGSSRRLNAHTDENGVATFHLAPATVSLSISGPPDGFFILGDLRWDQDATRTFDFPGGEAEITLKMPRLDGPLFNVSGICTLADGRPAAGVEVNSSAGHFLTSTAMGLIPKRLTDAAGRFTLEGVPAGQMLNIYAEADGRKLAGTTQVQLPLKANPAFSVKVSLAPTVEVEKVILDQQNHPIASRKYLVTPKVGDDPFPFQRRTVESDELGRIKLDGIVRGLKYEVVEETPPLSNGLMMRINGKPDSYEGILILAPDDAK
ncbi:M56 family metallopeptidase [Singulisphaera sp. PoT]|uniref:M56 family metallopeptidase n=1 Tax=Singulisphaera sp. PoT TaxID=3411797 RepID=UPI003BF520D2